MAHSSSFAGLREAIHNEEYEKCAEIAADLSKELPDDPEGMLAMKLLGPLITP